jgi:6-pyruvoyltetrahydropterin/6-carboxytetrahydropterin synthase
MPIVRVTRRVHFAAAHRLHNPEFTEDHNREVFGLCNNPNWHGHNYELDITVEGEIEPSTGFVIDLKRLRDMVEETVLMDVDHRNLNLDVAWMSGIIPSTENLVVALWEKLAPAIPQGRLVRLILWETPRNYVEYTGE